MNKNKMLPCPFCGSKPKMDNDCGSRFWMSCPKCHASSGPAWDKKSAQEAWNKRKV